MNDSKGRKSRREFIKTSGTVVGAATAMAALGMADHAEAQTVEINAQMPTADAELTIQYGAFSRTNELRLSRTQAATKEVSRYQQACGAVRPPTSIAPG